MPLKIINDKDFFKYKYKNFKNHYEIINIIYSFFSF